MNFLDALNTSATGLSAQRLRMNLIASNLANVNTPQAKEGNAYHRKDAVFAAKEQQSDFGDALARHLHPGLTGVQVVAIRDDDRPPILKYDPTHPDANEEGFVTYPNVDVQTELVDLMVVRRLYEANATVFQAAKRMLKRAMDI